MSFRDWMIVIGFMVLLGLIIDALRRVRLQYKLKREMVFNLEEIQFQEDDYSSELPNGGARIKRKESLENTQDLLNSSNILSQKSLEENFVSFTNNLSESLIENENKMQYQYDDLESSENMSLKLDDEKLQDNKDIQKISNQTLRKDSYDGESTVNSKNNDDQNHIKHNEDNVDVDFLVKDKNSTTLSMHHSYNRESGIMKDYAVLHIESYNGRVFPGDYIFNFFLDREIYLNKDNVFQCVNRKKNNENEVLFKVVNGHYPGYFDSKKIFHKTYSILTFIMNLSEIEKTIEAFEMMISIIDNLSRNLCADVTDQNHQLMTQKILEQYRDKVSFYEKVTCSTKEE